MKVVYSRLIGRVYVQASIELGKNKTPHELLSPLGLTVKHIQIRRVNGKFVSTCIAEYEPLKNSESIPRILQLINKLGAAGWDMDKKNFIACHYGYKKSFVFDIPERKRVLVLTHKHMRGSINVYTDTDRKSVV